MRLSSRSGAVVFWVALFCAAAACAHPAEVENIPPGRYFEVTLNEIQQAKASIRVYMYLIALPPNRLGSKVYPLVDALAEAKGRGVAVQVVLDRNMGWAEDSNLGFWDSAGKNSRAYRYLRERGVEVFFDEEAVLTHAKVLVMDGRTVIVGSTNWSEAAFTKNMEANVLVRSKGFAREILEGFKGLKLHAPEFMTSGAVPVPWAFLNNKKLLGRMVTAHDERAFDTYLYLLKTLRENEEEKGTLDIDALEGELEIRGEDEWNNRRAVRRVLGRLQDQYGLIAFSYELDKDPVVSLKARGSREAVEVPFAYWEWGWSKKLTFTGKAMFLLGQMYSALSPTAPAWFRSTGDLAKRHGFSRAFVGDGLMNLRRHNLVEVEPGKLNPPDYGDRDANRYAPNPLYDPTEMDRAFRKLEEKYGREKAKKATGYLSLVYEDSDVEAAERLIMLEEEFGSEVVRQAVKVVGEMSGNNPKKTIGYLIATIQGIGRREGQKVP